MNVIEETHYGHKEISDHGKHICIRAHFRRQQFALYIFISGSIEGSVDTILICTKHALIKGISYLLLHIDFQKKFI